MKNQKKSKSPNISRREFLGKTALAATSAMIVPRHVLGGPGYSPPSDKLNIACIGVGGKGRSDTKGVSSENIYALCDVDENELNKTADKYKKAKKYKDFRKMLNENHKNIDAVVISTPDHTHAVAASMAMRMGKHAFVQKPLTHTVREARHLRMLAKEMKVITQMGNQGHASEGARLINEWIWAGAIGDVREVHAWTNRPIWAQGIDAPKEVPSVPRSLDWNLWLGPAKFRPYHPKYAPFSWRGWLDFGTGALGDMGAHILDQPFWALKLHSPNRVSASSTPFSKDSYPMASTVHLDFPAREGMPAVKFHWYDGGLAPQRPEELEPGRRMGDGDGGVLFVGDKGKLMCGTYGSNPRIIPETKMKAFKRPEKTIKRSPGVYKEWLEAIKTNTQAASNFEYAGLLTEMMLLGNIAMQVQKENVILEWDHENMKFTNHDEANAYLDKKYYGGFELM